MSEPRVLPDRPDLRHLRREAKRRRKAGEFSSIALAQLAVARDYGFRSWPGLKFHVEAVTLEAPERAAALIGVGDLGGSAAGAGVARRRSCAWPLRPRVRVRHRRGRRSLATAVGPAGRGERSDRPQRMAAGPLCLQDLVDYALGRALNFPNPAMIEMFCTHGARASAGNLHQAIWRRRPPQTVAALLDAGAPIDAPDEHGLTPLQIAVRWGEEAVAALLRQRGADQASITDEDRDLGAYLSGRGPALPDGIALSVLDEMAMMAIQGGTSRRCSGCWTPAHGSTAIPTATRSRSAMPAGADACRWPASWCNAVRH
jgi:hypothetical protein